MMKQLLSVAVLIAAVALPGGVVPGCKSKQRPKKALVVRGYLIVDVRAPKEWLSAHDVRIVFDGKEYHPPAVFRVEGNSAGVRVREEKDGHTATITVNGRTGKLVCSSEARLGSVRIIVSLWSGKDALSGDDFSFIQYWGCEPLPGSDDRSEPSDEYITDLLSRAVMIDVSP